MGVSTVDLDRLTEALRASVDRARAEQRADGGDRLMSSREVCTFLGIERSTWRAYQSRGRAPLPDDRDELRPEGSRIPRWRMSTVLGWQRSRKRVHKGGGA